MPRYHFHSADGTRFLDKEGVELAGEPEARLEAARLSGAVLADDPTELWRSGHWRVEVTDEDGVLLFTIITLAVDAPRPEDLGSPRARVGRRPPGLSA